MLTKVCPSCREEKLICDFYDDPSKSRGLSTRCKPCTKDYNARYYAGASEERRERSRAGYNRNRADRLLSLIRTRAAKKGIPYDLDAHRPAIRARFDKGRCEMTGIPFVIQNGRSAYGPSIDRIDPKKGYVYTNIRIVLDIMNVAMNAFGEETLRDVMSEWLKRKRDG